MNFIIILPHFIFCASFQFGVFRKKGQILKYTGKESTHTPGTLRAILSGVLNRNAELTSRKSSIHYEGVEKIYPDHANSLCKVVLAPPNFLTRGDLWIKQYERADIEKEPDVRKKKNIMKGY